jgi:hypothetical protein
MLVGTVKMWLELTRDNDDKELFNMATCVNISPRDDNEPGSQLWYLGVNASEWVTVDVVESVADLKIALGAIGKPNVL